MGKKPNWEAFGKQIMESWPYGGIDGMDLQDAAEKHGVIIAVEGGFNSQIHTCPEGYSEDGDPFYLRNYDASGHTTPSDRGTAQ